MDVKNVKKEWDFKKVTVESLSADTRKEYKNSQRGPASTRIKSGMFGWTNYFDPWYNWEES